MQRLAIIFLSAVSLLLSISTVCSASKEKAVVEMASILLQLNHRPSDNDKATLKALMHNNGVSNDTKIVIQAIINMNHSTSDADKLRLQAVINDKQVAQDIRTLATIVSSMNHKPNAVDRTILTKLQDTTFVSDK